MGCLSGWRAACLTSSRGERVSCGEACGWRDLRQEWLVVCIRAWVRAAGAGRRLGMNSRGGGGYVSMGGLAVWGACVGGACFVEAVAGGSGSRGWLWGARGGGGASGCEGRGERVGV